jgi:hypothetical protein
LKKATVVWNNLLASVLCDGRESATQECPKQCNKWVCWLISKRAMWATRLTSRALAGHRATAWLPHTRRRQAQWDCP